MDWSPWDPQHQMVSLWAVREQADVQERVNWWLDLLWEHTNEVGTWNKLDPLANFEGVAAVDGPHARELVVDNSA